MGDSYRTCKSRSMHSKGRIAFSVPDVAFHAESEASNNNIHTVLVLCGTVRKIQGNQKVY